MTARKIKVKSAERHEERNDEQPSPADGGGAAHSSTPPSANGESANKETGTVSQSASQDEDAAAEALKADPLQAALAERDELREKWLRAEAELENYRKRVRREAEEARRYEALALARDLLPALDNLHRAVAAARAAENAGGSDLVQGVEMVAGQIEDVLARHSVRRIEAVGEPFDPSVHEAIQQVPSTEHPAMTVVEEIERGYRLHDRVVRPAKVIVSAGPPEE